MDSKFKCKLNKLLFAKFLFTLIDYGLRKVLRVLIYKI